MKSRARMWLERCLCVFGRHVYTITYENVDDGVAVFECIRCPNTKIDHDYGAGELE
jgi:hypothetical protein